MIEPLEVIPVRVTNYQTLMVSGTELSAIKVEYDTLCQDPNVKNLSAILIFGAWIIFYWPNSPIDEEYFYSDDYNSHPIWREKTSCTVRSLKSIPYWGESMEEIKSFISDMDPAYHGKSECIQPPQSGS